MPIELADLYTVIDKVGLSLGAACATILLVLPLVALYGTLRECHAGTVRPASLLFRLLLSLAAFIILTEAMAHWLDLVI